MGDRANIVITEHLVNPQAPTGAVVLYTHWSGTELPQIAHSALSRGRGRWDDSPYLARIVFSEMVKGDIEGETGYGISAGTICDNEHPIIVINTTNRTISCEGGPTLSLNDFVSAPQEQAAKVLGYDSGS